MMRFRIFMSQSPRAPHRTVLDTLASYGSCHRKKARRLSVALLGSSRFRLAQRNCNDPPPSLHGHYTHFITTKGQSDPERCIGTFGLMAVATCAFSLGITVVWVPTVFSKNRDRLLGAEVARKFLAELLTHKEVRALLSDEHFSVDGTQVQAWASMKSFVA